MAAFRESQLIYPKCDQMLSAEEWQKKKKRMADLHMHPFVYKDLKGNLGFITNVFFFFIYI